MQRFLIFFSLVLALSISFSFGASAKAQTQESSPLVLAQGPKLGAGANAGSQMHVTGSYQLDAPSLRLPRRNYRWGVGVFITGAATAAIGSISYALSAYCEGDRCIGHDPNGLLLIPAFGGLALLTAGIVGWVIGKIRHNSAMRNFEPPPLRARAW